MNMYRQQLIDKSGDISTHEGYIKTVIERKDIRNKSFEPI